MFIVGWTTSTGALTTVGGGLGREEPPSPPLRTRDASGPQATRKSPPIASTTAAPVNREPIHRRIATSSQTSGLAPWAGTSCAIIRTRRARGKGDRGAAADGGSSG